MRSGNRGWRDAAVACLIAGAGALAPATASAARFSWSAPVPIDASAPFTTTHAITAAACPSASLCVAGDDHGDILASTRPSGGGASWTATREVDPPGAIAGISCPSRKLCVAAGAHGDLVTSTRPTEGLHAWKVARGVVPRSAGLRAISCASTRLCVAVDGVGDVITSTRPTLGKRGWTRAVVIPHRRHDALVSVACPSASVCVAIDRTGRWVAHSGHPADGGRSWHLIAARSPLTPDYAPPSITCASVHLCLYVGNPTDGSSAFVVTTSQPTGGRGAWRLSRTVPVEPGYLLSVSCTAKGLCVADGDPYNGAVVYSSNPRGGGRTWKVAYQPPQSASGTTGVACAPAFVCVAYDAAGNLIGSAHPAAGPSAWAVSGIDGVNSLDAVDCTSASFCAAGGSGNRVLTTATPTGGAHAWTTTTIGLSPTTISCPSTLLCVAAGNGGDGGIDVSTNPGAAPATWQLAETAPLLADDEVSAGQLSCPTVSLCVVPYYGIAEEGGDLEATFVLNSTNPAGGTSAWQLADPFIDGGINGGSGGGDGRVVAISCAAATLCVGVDDAGRVLASAASTNGRSWSHIRVDAKRAFTGISCPSAGLCVAVDAAGDAVASRDLLTGRWQVTHVDPAAGLAAISCPTTSLCVAVDGARNAFVSTDPTGGRAAWKRTTGLDGGLTALSCPNASLCVAVDGDGNAIIGRR